MDGENNGKPYDQMDDLGGPVPPFKEALFLETPIAITHRWGAEEFDPPQPNLTW